MSGAQVPDEILDRWAAGVVDLTSEEAHAVVSEVRRLRSQDMPLDLELWDAEAARAVKWGISHDKPERIVALIAEVVMLRARLAAASEIHAPQPGDRREICYECETAWPCPTAAALTGVAWISMGGL